MSDSTPSPSAAGPRANPEQDRFDLLLSALAPVLSPAAADPEPGEDRGTGVLRPVDDVALATQAAEQLFTDESALQYFPRDAAEILGPEDEWRWCLPYVRCCWMFGWLVCHGCRDFTALNYYLYRYWLCVRAAMGRNPRAPVTEQEREDFRRLAALLGQTYSGWLKEEELKVELDRGAVDDVLAGKADCCRDNAFTAALFDRLASNEAAEALLGREAFAAHARNPWFWLCRCWCRAAIRFGCCLACARSREEMRRCLAEYEHSLEDCLGPLRCHLVNPTGCFEEQPILDIQDIGVPVTGDALGAFFGGYTIEWRFVEGEACDGPHGWHSEGVVYPGHGPIGSTPVQNGTLGWINTRLLPARSYEVRICLKSSKPGAAPPCCCIIFNLFKRFVWINRVGAAWVGDGGVYDPNAPLVYPPLPDPSSHLVPVGCCVNIHGAAWVGECNDRRIKCFSLRYAPGFLPGPTEPGFNPGLYTALPGQAPVCYTPPDEAEKRAQPNELTANDSILTTHWEQVTIDYSYLFHLPPHTVELKEWQLRPKCWDSRQLPACLDQHHTCASGQYTLLLDVEDTQGNHYYDTQHVWFDNKDLHVTLAGLEGWHQCQTLQLHQFAGSKPCAVPWPVPVMGTVYDEYIDPNGWPLVYPNNNFDFYTLTITRNCGGPSYSVPITRDWVHFDKDILTGQINELKGTAHVGIPASVCACDPQLGTPHQGVLAAVDMRIFDAVCVSQVPPKYRPLPGFALQRGECCTFTFTLYAQDKTVDDVGPGNCHHASASCCIQICNDLPHHHLPDVSGPVVDHRAGDALTQGSPLGGPDGPG